MEKNYDISLNNQLNELLTNAGIVHIDFNSPLGNEIIHLASKATKSNDNTFIKDVQAYVNLLMNAPDSPSRDDFYDDYSKSGEPEYQKARTRTSKEWEKYDTTLTTLTKKFKTNNYDPSALLYHANFLEDFPSNLEFVTNNTQCMKLIEQYNTNNKKEYSPTKDFIDTKFYNTKTKFMENQKNHENHEIYEANLNFDYTRKQLSDKGFKDDAYLLSKLTENQKVPGQFTIPIEGESYTNGNVKVPVNIQLHFNNGYKSEQSFFNGFHMSFVDTKTGELKERFFPQKMESEIRGKEKTVYPNLTKKEAFNLLDGRAVHKNITIQINGVSEQRDIIYHLDFEKLNRNNQPSLIETEQFKGLSVKHLLADYKLKSQDNQDMIKSLEKGNITLIQFDNGKECFAQLNGKSHYIDFIDADGKKLFVKNGNTPEPFKSKAQENIPEKKSKLAM